MNLSLSIFKYVHIFNIAKYVYLNYSFSYLENCVLECILNYDISFRTINKWTKDYLVLIFYQAFTVANVISD